jgi:hypothetical protein
MGPLPAIPDELPAKAATKFIHPNCATYCRSKSIFVAMILKQHKLL